MRILSLNAWGGRLYSELIAYLKTQNPDVLCLQEVISTHGSTENWLDYRDQNTSLPQRANLFSEVAAALPDHVAMFCPAAQGVLWHDDKPLASQWGLATYVRSNLPIIEQVQGFIHGGFSPNGYGDHPRSRNAHGVRLFDFERQKAVSIVHLHGLRELTGKAESSARISQAKRLATLVASIVGEQDDAIVCGDFNILPTSTTFEILRNLGLTDLVTTTGCTSTRTSYYQKSERFADYLFINRLELVEKFEVVTDPEISDHCPLILTIRSSNN